MVKKSPCPPSGYFGYEYELTIQFNTVYNSFCACLRLANRRILCFIKIFLEKQYIASEKDISLTWNGIVNIMDVEETINNIFEPKEPNKQ